MAAGEPYQYIVVHRSVARLPGVLAAQVAHAARRSLSVMSQPHDPTNVVALVAETAKDLHAAAKALEEAGIHHVLILEPDPPYSGKPTAIGVEPVTDRSKVREILKGFKLLQ